MKKLFNKEGIVHQYSATYNHYHNGLVERFHQMVAGRVSTILIESGFTRHWWGEAAAYTVRTWNRTPQYIRSTYTTPYCCTWKSYQQPPIIDFKPFGCECVVHTQKERRIGTIGPKGRIAYFIGYPTNQKGWRVWSPTEQKIRTSADVKFNEGRLLADSKYVLKKMENLPRGNDKKKEALKKRLKSQARKFKNEAKNAQGNLREQKVKSMTS